MNYQSSNTDLPNLAVAYRLTLIVLVIVFILMSVFTGCQRTTPPQDTPSSTSPSADHGRVIYQTQCIACHNSNPHKPGSIGPDIFGSSKELLQARILKGDYPPGYQPKRSTHNMAALPHLKDEIDSLHAYLNSDPSLNP